MKSIAMEFSLFASPDSSLSRGDSDAFGPKRFDIDDFQDSLYGLDEFWGSGDEDEGEVAGKSEIMLCPAAPTDLVKLRGWSCSNVPFRPQKNVSLAMNMRLFRAEVEFDGQMVLAPLGGTRVRPTILDHPYVPLVMDVDGAQAMRNITLPVYIAPPAASPAGSPYGSGRFWAPSARHGGRTNVAFVGGHVLGSADPAAETWDWSYQAEVD
jgi:prepilin-type processing-associated H-X9-DG protein